MSLAVQSAAFCSSLGLVHIWMSVCRSMSGDMSPDNVGGSVSGVTPPTVSFVSLSCTHRGNAQLGHNLVPLKF